MELNLSPQFSIITPVYNREDCISRCVDSVISQDFGDWELIVVDDGSKDSSYQIAHKYSVEDSRIKAFQLPINKGTNSARNFAIERANGNFIIILDSDDYFVDGALSYIYKTIEEHPNYHHFLFQADDLIEYYKSNPKLKLENGVCQLQYSDWLSGALGEDFIHVIDSSIMKKYPFNEETRILEGVNFMRFFREGKFQLYIPKLITIRERERSDSVTPSALITNRKSMERCYIANSQWIEWFAEDAIGFGYENSVNQKKKLCAILSLCLNKYSEYPKYSESLRPKINSICNFISSFKCGWILRNIVIVKTKLKYRK